MRTGTHHKANRDWVKHVPEDMPNGWPDSRVMLALLMDIRAELRGINATLDCRNTRDIPVQLRGLRRDLNRQATVICQLLEAKR